MFSNSARCSELSLRPVVKPFLSMFSSSGLTFVSPRKVCKMPKRKLTRSSLNNSPVKSPSLDKFFKSTKERKVDMSPKHLTRSEPSSPDIRKYLSPSGESRHFELPTLKRIVPKRRVNLNSVFEHIVPQVPVYSVSESCDKPTKCLKRNQSQPSPDQPLAKCTKTDSDQEQLVPSTAPLISAVSYKTDHPPQSDPNVCPPPCIKRTWKTVPSRPGIKLFDANSPQTSSKLQLLCRKLWFSSPNSCEIQTLS